MKKGFTLVELLAVIVILTVIAFITIPMILNVIEKVRRASAESSALGYIDAVEKDIVIHVTTDGSTFQDGVYDVNDVTVKVKGSKPIKGWYQIESNQVNYYSFIINGYIITKGKETSKGTEVEPMPSGEIGSKSLPKGLNRGTEVYVNPETKKICSQNDSESKTDGCMKWYVYKINDDGTYQLILDHNTTAVVSWNSSGNNKNGMNEVQTALWNDTSTWDDSLNARLITADEIADLTGANSENTIQWNSSKSYGTAIEIQSSWFYLDGGRNENPTIYESKNNGWQRQYANETIRSNYAWLFDNTDGCIKYGCNIDNASTYGYWTGTPVFDHTSSAWRVGRHGTLNYYDITDSTYYGVRPVIQF